MALDFGAAAREAEATLKRLDELRQELEALAVELRRAAERQAIEVVKAMVDENRREAAERVATRAVRVADEVAAWSVARSPWGLAQRMLPELRAMAGDVRDYLETPTAQRVTVTPLPRSNTPPAPARPAP